MIAEGTSAEALELMNRRDLITGAASLFIGAEVLPSLAADSASKVLPDKTAFPIAGTYLNNAGFHPISLSCARAVKAYLDSRVEGVIKENHPLESTQGEVLAAFASLIHAHPSEVSLVQSTMVGENLVLAGLGFPHVDGNIVTDELHFEGSLYMYRTLQKQGLDVRVVKPREWRIDLKDVEEVIDNKTRLIAVSLVSFLNGFQYDLKGLCDLAHVHGARVYADIIQAAGAVPIDVHASGVDFCACASYKWLMGDFGLGFMYVREDLLGSVIKRTQYGWQQFSDFEYHFRPYDKPANADATWRPLGGAAGYFQVGTLATAALACLNSSLKYIQQLGVERIQSHAQSMTQRLLKELPSLGFECLTPSESRTPIVTFVVRDLQEVANRLARAKVKIKMDQHCFRVSPSVYNDQYDIDRLLNALS